MGVLGFPLGRALGRSLTGAPPFLPQPDVDTLTYSDGLGTLPSDDTGTDVSMLTSLNGSWPSSVATR